MLSVIIPCYNPDPELLRWHTEAWLSYPDGIEVICVDDCSSMPIRAVLPIKPTIIARILVDIPWNQPGARNLGAHLARGEWLLFCDIDHRFEPETIAELLEKPKQETMTYYFARKQIVPNEEPRNTGPHFGTVLISADRFAKLGGWDEDFSGHYGYDDRFFYARSKGSLEHLSLCVYTRSDHVADRDRDPARNRELIAQKMQLLSQGKYSPPRQLRFDWECLI